MKNGLCITTFLVATTLVGCTQNNGPEAKFSTLTQVVGAAAEEDCPTGGIELEHGIDTNGNGTLEANEVQERYTLCHGASGSSSIVMTREEPPGENCEYGGIMIVVGQDLDQNGGLSEDEPQEVTFICNAAPGSDGTSSTSLISMTAEPPGDNCEHGGQRVDAGVDDNGNGSLDPDEVDSTEYVCNGAYADYILDTPPKRRLRRVHVGDSTQTAVTPSTCTLLCENGAYAECMCNGDYAKFL